MSEPAETPCAAVAQWPADRVQRRLVSELIPSARNARTHSVEQVNQLCASIEEWGWTMPVLVDETGGIIAGHGWVMAALVLGPVEVCRRRTLPLPRHCKPFRFTANRALNAHLTGTTRDSDGRIPQRRGQDA